MYDSEYVKTVKKLPSYVANPNLTSLLQWKPAEGGRILVVKSSQKLFIGVAIVQVYDYKLNCAPNGNFIKPDLGSLERAKFQLYAGRPADINFGADFPNVYANLTKLQNEIAVTKEKKDMLYSDAAANMIRFARPVFEKREKPVRDSPPVVYYEDVMNPESKSAEEELDVMDEETKNWPVEEKYRDALDLIKPTHKAVPLRVYRDSDFIEPPHVNDTLRNAIIEVQFSLNHTHLPNQTPPRDSFRATIEQIRILKTGDAADSKGYSSFSPRSGPILPTSTSFKREASKEPRSSTRAPAKKAKLAPQVTYSEEKGKGKARADEHESAEEEESSGNAGKETAETD